MKDLVAFLRQPKEEGGEHVGAGGASTETSAFSREVGALYEKLRFAVDNKEEHFFRRYAIRRALRRVSLFSNDPQRLLSILIADLVRGGYLADGQLGKSEMGEAKQALTAFTQFQSRLRDAYDASIYFSYRQYLLDIVAGAIEDAFYDTSREEAVAVMMARVGEGVVLGEELRALDEEKRKLLFYVASWRSLFVADASLLRYKLWLIACPNWEKADGTTIASAVAEFPNVISRINRLINHRIGGRILPKLHDLSIAHTLLYDMVCQYGTGVGSIISQPDLFEAHIRDCVEERYRRDIGRARRRSVRAILYILVTKSLLAVSVESVYVFVWKQALNYVAVVTNLVAHPALLFLLTGGLRRPSAQNTTRAVMLTSAIVYGDPIPAVVLSKESRGVVTDIALGLYVAFLGACILGIVLGLNAIAFHAVDIGIFLLFLLLVLYFAFRIRFSAYRMRFANTKEGFLRSLIELLLLPLVSLGRWMSLRFENLNVAVLFLDFFIEVPLRLLLRFLDVFTTMVERKREEIYTP